jgi:hypothetical protein
MCILRDCVMSFHLCAVKFSKCQSCVMTPCAGAVKEYELRDAAEVGGSRPLSRSGCNGLCALMPSQTQEEKRRFGGTLCIAIAYVCSMSVPLLRNAVPAPILAPGVHG